MEQNMTALAAMQYSSPIEPADVVVVDVEEVTRKRARIEARRKFRIVTSTIVACGRFRFVLEVDAEKPEQAESEILALKTSLENMGVQTTSEESVDSRITRQQGLFTTYPGAEGEMVTLPNATNCGSLHIPNHGFPLTERMKIGPYEQAEEKMIILPNAIDYASHSIPDQGYFTTEQEECGAYEQAEREMTTLPYATDCGTFSIPNQGDSKIERHGSGQYEQVQGNMTTLPEAMNGFLSVTNEEHSIVEREETVPYGQEGWLNEFLNESDLTNEVCGNAAPEDGGVKDTSRRLWSDWEPLENLRKMDGTTEHWATLASELNDQITRKIQDLEAGSGRAKVQKLNKDADEITKRIGLPGPAPEGKKFQKMQAKATSTTLPTVRDVGQYLSEVFEKLQSYVDELSPIVNGRQKSAMARLIEDGRKALIALGRGTDWISEKLTTLQKDLKFRELTVDRHFQKCAEIIPAEIQSFLKERKGNFISVASLIDWYFEDMSSRNDGKVSSSASSDFASSDFDEFLSVF